MIAPLFDPAAFRIAPGIAHLCAAGDPFCASMMEPLPPTLPINPMAPPGAIGRKP